MGFTQLIPRARQTAVAHQVSGDKQVRCFPAAETGLCPVRLPSLVLPSSLPDPSPCQFSVVLPQDGQSLLVTLLLWNSGLRLPLGPTSQCHSGMVPAVGGAEAPMACPPQHPVGPGTQ